MNDGNSQEYRIWCPAWGETEDDAPTVRAGYLEAATEEWVHCYDSETQNEAALGVELRVLAPNGRTYRVALSGEWEICWGAAILHDKESTP